MADFKKWLVRERQMSPESARVYQSRIKSMLNRLPDTITSEDVSNYLNSEAYSQSRSAYRAFRTFVKEENIGIELPDYEAKKGQIAQQGKYLPHLFQSKSWTPSLSWRRQGSARRKPVLAIGVISCESLSLGSMRCPSMGRTTLGCSFRLCM